MLTNDENQLRSAKEKAKGWNLMFKSKNSKKKLMEESQLPTLANVSLQDSSSPLAATKVYPLYMAKYNYADDDLSIRKGDQLYIIDSTNKDRWLAKVKCSGETGYVPSNYVVDFNSLDAND